MNSFIANPLAASSSEQDILVSEDHAVSIASASVKTLHQYCKAGILQPIEKDGVRHYNRHQLAVVFNLKHEEPTHEQTADVLQSNTQNTDNANHDNANHGNANHYNTAASCDEPQVASSFAPDAERVADRYNASKLDNPLPVQVQQQSAENPVFDLLQDNSSLKDQIQVLREERDWLRKRLEVSEERMQRDQMLMISKSETIRQLVQEKTNPPKRFWEYAIPWLKAIDSPKALPDSNQKDASQNHTGQNHTGHKTLENQDN